MDVTSLDWATFGLLVCTTLFTGILMVGALFTALQARRSADAATGSGIMMRIEHDARMRPWVGLVELACEDEEWNTVDTWRMSLKNFGILPASEVQVEVVVSLGSGNEWQLTPSATLGMLYPTQERFFRFSFGEPFAGQFAQKGPTYAVMAVHVHYRVFSIKDQLTEYWVYRPDFEHKSWYPVLERLVEAPEITHPEEG